MLSLSTLLLIAFCCTAFVNAKPKKFNYRVSNDNPTWGTVFDENVTISLTTKKHNLEYYMKMAAEQDNRPEFNHFILEYFRSQPANGLDGGYFVHAINRLYSDWSQFKNYWGISNAGVSLNVGISGYLPRRGDEILVKLKDGGH